MSCVGWAVRTVSCSCGGRRTPFSRRRSSVHSSSSASTPRWRACSQTCNCVSRRWAAHMQLGRGGGQRGEFDLQVELLGQLQPGIALGPLAHRRHPALPARAAPKRRATPARGRAAQIAPGAAADALQRGHMLPRRGQHIERKIVRQPRRPRFAAQLQAQQAQGRQARCGPAPIARAPGAGVSWSSRRKQSPCGRPTGAAKPKLPAARPRPPRPRAA